jgi:hypothetical protein
MVQVVMKMKTCTFVIVKMVLKEKIVNIVIFFFFFHKQKQKSNIKNRFWGKEGVRIFFKEGMGGRALSPNIS